MYTRARDPRTWSWFAKSTDATAAKSEESDELISSDAPPEAETIVPSPTDLNAKEIEEAARQFEVVSDRSALASIEMPAYWRLMRWARAQSFENLERRAERNVIYAKLWEQPEKYRGKPLRLRLHVRRVVSWDAAENSAGVEHVYEASGGTDESKSHPYIVVFSELPPQMQAGADVREECVFVGYFLKTLLYTDAVGTSRAAPLLIGRIRSVASPRAASRPNGHDSTYWFSIVGGGVVLLLMVIAWVRHFRSRTRRTAAAQASPANEAAVEEWLTQQHDSPPDEFTPPG
jgi:hypothetical protein